MQNDRKMTIHFKNGQTIEVANQIVDIISNHPRDNGFVHFSDETKHVFLVVNLSEIVYIKQSPLHNLTRTLADKPE